MCGYFVGGMIGSTVDCDVIGLSTFHHKSVETNLFDASFSLHHLSVASGHQSVILELSTLPQVHQAAASGVFESDSLVRAVKYVPDLVAL